MAVPIFRYPLDETGENPNNRVNNEPHDLIPKQRLTDVRVFSPLYGPFYANDLMEIRDMADGRILDRGTDFEVTDLLQDPTLKFAQEIGQFIVVTNGTVSNRISISYQVLGGNYQNDSTAVAQAYATFMNDSRPVDWNNISNKPATFPPSLHIHLLEDVIGWGPMIVALNNVEQAILLSCTPMVEALIDWMKDRPVKWSSVYETPTTVDGYGITDAVKKTGDEMTGTLKFRDGNRILFNEGGELQLGLGGSNSFYQNGGNQIPRVNTDSTGTIGIQPRQGANVCINNVNGANTMTVYPDRMNLAGSIGLLGRDNGSDPSKNERTVEFPGGMYLFGNQLDGGRIGFWDRKNDRRALEYVKSDSTLFGNSFLFTEANIHLLGANNGLSYAERTVTFPGGMYLYGNDDGGGVLGFHNNSDGSGYPARSFRMKRNGDIDWMGTAFGSGAGITDIDWNNIVNKPNLNNNNTKVVSYNGGSWGYTRMWTDNFDPGPGNRAKVFIQWVNGPAADDEVTVNVNWPITFSEIFTAWVSTDSKGDNPTAADYVFQTRSWNIYGAVLFAQGTYGGGRGGVTPWVFGIGTLD